MMRRAFFIGAALIAAALLASAAIFGPELLSGYRFMDALDRHYVDYEANGGAWPQTQDTCTLCHGAGGQPQDGQYAALAGQPAAYIQTQLHAFATGRRHSPQMEPLAASLSETQILTLAEYFANQQPGITEAPERNDVLSQRGKMTVATHGCVACHGNKLSGGPIGPRIAGQGEGYLRDQLKAFRQGQRKDPNQAMNAIASQLSDDEIEATAHYLAGLAPAVQ